VRFVHQLEEVRDSVLTMGSMVDKAVDYAVDALRRRDAFTMQRIIKDDRLMASDLRFLASVLHITTDLERMGDHARSIARLGLKLGAEPPLKLPAELQRMADLCRDRLRRALDAFVARDADAAQLIASQDTATDEMQDAIYRDLLQVMLDDPSAIRRATHLLWVAHNVERIGDHITNVCERVIFTVTGQMEELTEQRSVPDRPGPTEPEA
jgi:phosphate transport system protein